MSFHEKSAWIMALALLFGGAFYVKSVASASEALGQLAPPTTPNLLSFALTLTVIAVVGHIVVAATAPDDADEITDERVKKIHERASHLSGYVLAIGVLITLGLYLFTYDGDVMFYILFASLVCGQLTEYAVQILFLRTSIF